MVGIEPEAPADRSGCIAYVYADKSSTREHPDALPPDRVELQMHQFIRAPSVTVTERDIYPFVEAAEGSIPHLDHRIRRGSDDEIDRLIRDRAHVGGRAVDHAMTGGYFHTSMARPGTLVNSRGFRVAMLNPWAMHVAAIHES